MTSLAPSLALLVVAVSCSHTQPVVFVPLESADASAVDGGVRLGVVDDDGDTESIAYGKGNGSASSPRLLLRCCKEVADSAAAMPESPERAFFQRLAEECASTVRGALSAAAPVDLSASRAIFRSLASAPPSCRAF